MAQAGKTYDVTVNGYAFGGETIGRLPDGRAVFVPFAIPGERVRVALVTEKRGFARARLVEVLDPSPQRISPRCRHFGVCGGCDYQHMPYETQLEAKRAVVRDQLQRIGGIADPVVQPVVACPEPYYYRNTVQFHQDKDGRLGYYRHDGQGVLAIAECHLPLPLLNQVWPQVELEPIPDLERIGLRQGVEDEVLLWMASENPEPPEMELDLPISTVYLSPDGALILAGDNHVVLEVLGRPFRVSAGSFFQVNTVMAAEMANHLLHHLPLTPDTTLLDVYCGVGLFSAFLAPRVKSCIGIELSESAVNDFAANLDEFDNVSVYLGAAEDVLPNLDVRADVLLVDPPREGLDRRALDAIVTLAPPVIAYVSCDPATLARDLKRLLAAGYALEQVTPFDLFPQTYHVECVVFLRRE
ncbi:MAG TPA: class I SAM-dependent RNA methyltransferase [Anaerolineaceae bacterium]|nr:class I SAM-dependent RNA methyltransferase [Anaerolineaceae bacterium]